MHNLKVEDYVLIGSRAEDLSLENNLTYSSEGLLQRGKCTNWTKNGSVVSTNATYSFTVTGAVDYVAHFTLNSYTVSATANPTAGGSITGTGTYNHGASATLTAIPATGYSFTNWTKNGTPVSTDASFTFTVTESTDFVANFSQNSYMITATANPAAGGSVNGAGSHTHGTTANLVATANPGYTFSNWTKNGTVVSTNANYSFTVTEAADYVANFSQNVYAINASANPAAGGSVDGAGNYNYGATATLTANANEGYTFTNWTKNGTQVSTSSTYTFTVEEAGEYVANFTLNSYTINATANPTAGGTVSGAGNYDYGKKEDPHQSVEKARYACTELKMHRSGTFLKYDQEMHDKYRLVQYVVRHIDEAIENGYIKAYYQPVAWSKDRTMCGAEALARWVDPKYGFLTPYLFIGALEDSQLIYKLDIAVLRIVCKDIRYNIDNGLPAIPVSINFSRFDFAVVDIVSMIDEVVTEIGIPKNLLHIEITESALTEDEDNLKKAMDRLHKLGYEIWLDDFGSGYSSFNVLKDFDFDMLKLDMKFLVGFEGNAKAKTLIKAVVQLADQIGMKTLCEGVETDEEAEFLKSVHCGRLQGYLIGKPMPYDEIKEKIIAKQYIISKDL